MHLSSSHQMFSHRTTTLFFGILGVSTYNTHYSVIIISDESFSQNNVMLHHIPQSLFDKTILFRFY